MRLVVEVVESVLICGPSRSLTKTSRCSTQLTFHWCELSAGLTRCFDAVWLPLLLQFVSVLCRQCTDVVGTPYGSPWIHGYLCTYLWIYPWICLLAPCLLFVLSVCLFIYAINFYARQLYRQVLLRARISYGISVRPSVCHNPVVYQAQVR